MEVANYYVQRGGQVCATFLDLSKAFDKCLFDKLFEKMLGKGIPPIIVRSLVYAYQEQRGWVRLAGKDSEEFTLTNGTRQGSVLSPYLFSACYLDDLFVELRRHHLGCHIAGVWVGATGFADDLALLAPNRDVLQRMILICEKYGAEHNLQFSTDPVPAKSKTKSMFFSGKRSRIQYPAPVVLNGKDLPWVETVDHLGHVIHQSLTMENDAARARASFMTRATDIREQFYFARPEQRINAIQLYCCDGYGSMLWDLQSDYAEKYFKAWNVQSRLAWNVPHDTHTYLVEGYFCAGFTSLRNQIHGRYSKFIQKLFNSPSKEVMFMINLVYSDARSPTCNNIKFLSVRSGLDIMKTASWKVKSLLPVQCVPQHEQFRIGLLNILLETKYCKSFATLNIDLTQCNAMITSLCNS